MADSILGDALRDTLKTSGLYIPPPLPTYPVVQRSLLSLRDLTIDFVSNNLYLVCKSPSNYPTDSTYQYACIYSPSQADYHFP